MVDSRAARLPAFAVVVAFACLIPSRVGAAAQDSGVTWLIFVDDLHLDFVNTGHARMLLRSIASELIRDGDAVALRSPGPSSLSIQLTTNRSRLDAAIRGVYGSELLPDDLLRSWSAVEIQDEARDRASIAESAAADMLKASASVSGRRVAMLYVSDGYPVDPLDRPIAGFAPVAKRANVTVFAINPRGLPGGARSVPVHGDAAQWAGYRAAMLNSLRAISEPTGGFAVLDEADFADALPRISRRVR